MGKQIAHQNYVTERFGAPFILTLIVMAFGFVAEAMPLSNKCEKLMQRWTSVDAQKERGNISNYIYGRYADATRNIYYFNENGSTYELDLRQYTHFTSTGTIETSVVSHRIISTPESARPAHQPVMQGLDVWSELKDFVKNNYKDRRENWSKQFISNIIKKIDGDIYSSRHIVAEFQPHKDSRGRPPERVVGHLKFVEAGDGATLLPIERYLGISLNGGDLRFEPANFVIEKETNAVVFGEMMVQFMAHAREQIASRPDLKNKKIYITYADEKSMRLYSALGFAPLSDFTEPITKNGVKWQIIGISPNDVLKIPKILRERPQYERDETDMLGVSAQLMVEEPEFRSVEWNFLPTRYRNWKRSWDHKSVSPGWVKVAIDGHNRIINLMTEETTSSGQHLAITVPNLEKLALTKRRELTGWDPYSTSHKAFNLTYDGRVLTAVAEPGSQYNGITVRLAIADDLSQVSWVEYENTNANQFFSTHAYQ